MTNEEKIALQREQISKLITKYSSREISIYDKEELSELKQIITRIFQLEIKGMGRTFEIDNPENNDITLDIVNGRIDEDKGACHTRFIRDENGKFIGKEHSITINIQPIIKDLGSFNEKTRILGCKNLLRAIFHEVRHYRQELMVNTNVSSKEGLMFAKDNILTKYLRDFYSHDEKTGNYEEFSIETDAEAAAYSQIVDVMGEIDEKSEKDRDKKIAENVLARYKIDTQSYDGKYYYNSNGLKERSDATAEVIDDFFADGQFLEYLEILPILKKEYNDNGSRKTISQLIGNMKAEKEDLLSTSDFSDIERDELIKSCEQMYTELIYRRIERDNERQINDAIELYGEEYISDILIMMQGHLLDEKNNKINVANKYREVKKDGRSYVNPINRRGITQIEEDGEIRTVTIHELSELIEPEIANRIVNIGTGDKTFSRFVRENFKRYIPTSGMYVLKDGSKISVKDFIESKFFEEGEFKNLISNIGDIVLSEPDAEYALTCERFEEYYGKKIDKLGELQQSISRETPTQESLQIATGINNSINNIAVTKKVRDISQGNSEIKATYKEFETQTHTIEER